MEGSGRPHLPEELQLTDTFEEVLQHAIFKVANSVGYTAKFLDIQAELDLIDTFSDCEVTKEKTRWIHAHIAVAQWDDGRILTLIEEDL